MELSMVLKVYSSQAKETLFTMKKCWCIFYLDYRQVIICVYGIRCKVNSLLIYAWENYAHQNGRKNAWTSSEILISLRRKIDNEYKTNYREHLILSYQTTAICLFVLYMIIISKQVRTKYQKELVLCRTIWITIISRK